MAPGDRHRISPTLRPHELKLASYPPSVKTTVSVNHGHVLPASRAPRLADSRGDPGTGVREQQQMTREAGSFPVAHIRAHQHTL